MSTSSIPLSEQALSPVAEEALATFKRPPATTPSSHPLFLPRFLRAPRPHPLLFVFDPIDLLAFTLATLLFTAFSYFPLLFPPGKKTARSQRDQGCSSPECLSRAHRSRLLRPTRLSLKELFHSLHRQEYRYYTLFSSLPTLSSSCANSASGCIGKTSTR